MVERAKPKSKIMQFFSNPVVGVTGTIASIVGVTLAIIFFVSGREHRELCFYANPARAVIFKAGQTSSLAISLAGEPVKRDICAVQVAFWNEGKESIKRENVLRPLVVKTGDKEKVPILEATIRKESRDVVETKLNRDRMEMGEIEVGWDILEQDDGAVIQVVYFGDAEVPITATSVIEGQRKIKEGENKTETLVFKIFAGILILFVLLDLFGILEKSKYRTVRKYFMLLCLSIYIISEVSGFFKAPGPPFGF